MYKEYKLVKEIMTPEYVKSLNEHELTLFCTELRQELISIISKTGGHIGVNLGILELTVALYRVFDFPEDFLVWDIGHQIYVQKMLTSRLPLLKEIRVNGGSPGYAYHKESQYEHVTSSHAGASLSFALGAAKANSLKQQGNTSIAVIGDGSFVEGSSQEALNHLSVDKSKTLYIINDNEMALDNNFGGWHEHFKRITVNPSEKNIFDILEIPYEGPVDGHDIITLVKTLQKYKESQSGPAVLHIKTIKGKGLETMANNSPVRIHWNFPFDTTTLENTEGPKSKSHTAIFAETIKEIIETEEDAFLVTPATLQNTGIYNLSKQYPEKVLDVGMAEQHAITFSGGMALQGLKPIVACEATFIQRTYDQIIHDLCISEIPVLIAAARSGHTGLDHTTHHALLDLSYLRCVPNLRVIYPATQADLADAVKEEYKNLKQPTIILFPYGGLIDDPVDAIHIDRKLPENFHASSNTLILSMGMQNKNAQQLQSILSTNNIQSDHIAVTEISDISEKFKNIINSYDTILTLEESILDGGFGSAIMEATENTNSTKIYRFGFPKRYIEHGTRDYIYEKYNLSAQAIYEQFINMTKG